MITDIHAHIASFSSLPERFYEGWIGNMVGNLPPKDVETARTRLRGLFERLHQDSDCDELVREMDQAGIARTVLLMIDFAFAYDSPHDDIHRLLDQHVRIMQRHPGRFICFAGIDPRRGKQGVELFRRAVTELGFGGLKLYPPCGFSPSAQELFPYYEICAHHGLPVLTHTGPTTPNLSFKHVAPLDVDDAARLFPNVNFILAHAGVVRYQEAVLQAEYRPNVYLDLAGLQNEVRRGQLKDVIRFHKARGVLHKLLFGTDWPIFRMYGKQISWVNKMRECVADGILTDSELKLVMADNANRLLRA